MLERPTVGWIGVGTNLELPLLFNARSRIAALIEQGMGDTEVTILAEPLKRED